MTTYKEIKLEKKFMGRLRYGCDLLEELNNICRARDIRLGKVEAIGAVQKAKIGFYNQETRVYQFMDLDFPAEIVNLTGNVSIKDDEFFVHAHVNLADESGKCYGGHLASGTIVFACEAVIHSFKGPEFKRDYDEETGLQLWKIS
jgi:predicted DNA-binding protein with PD1-like motif